MSDTITKRLRQGNLMAEVKAHLLPDDKSWGPYLSLDDARKLDRVNKALRRGDADSAAKDAKVFEVMEMAGERG